MRESQYVDAYLDATAEKPVTMGTFLARKLKGKAKDYAAGYQRALWRGPATTDRGRHGPRS